MTYDFQGTNGDTTTTQTSGSLSTTMVLTGSTISNVRRPSLNSTSLFVNGSRDNFTARAEVSNLAITPTQFTWEGWIYFPAFSAVATPTTGTYPTIFAIGQNGQNLMAVRWIGDRLIEFRTNLNNASISQGGVRSTSITPSSGVWQHHAITANGLEYRYYLDGISLDQTNNNFGTWGFSATAGRAINTYTIGNWIGAPFNGSYNNAYYWNCRLSSGVVYNSNFTVNKIGMI
jgi:hypothetical protein